MSDDEKKTPDYYNIDSYLKEAVKKPKPRSLPIRIVRRILGIFDPILGFWTVILSIPLIFGLAIGLLFLGLKYGAPGFYGGLTVTVTLGTFIIEKKYGKHLQIEDFPFVRRILAIIPAFLVLASILFLIIYLAGKF